MDKLALDSHAKLNLYLEVLNKRKDGYHNIKTLFERISLHDQIVLKSRKDKAIRIICSSPLVPRDNTNIASRAARLLQNTLRINKGVDIKIIKRIPLASGLAGGSSNAATVLVGLNRLWKLNLTRQKLVELAQELGSDVPFFIYNCPFALGESRGERIRPENSLKHVRLWHILVVPKLNVSTAKVYKAWDRLKNSRKAQLTRPKYDVKILTSALRRNALSIIGRALFNSLEPVTAKLYSEVVILKESLRILGLKSILMSGSGPAIFGIVSSRKEAVRLYRGLRKNRFLEVFVTRTR
ncbi:MAG: 4-(cytidine 5'-diphospho)-2-C-methyl-D-erythritol kinase [Candidatus Omnitrophota bacterium]